MDLASLVSTFATASSYNVTRTARGAIDRGHIFPGTVSTVPIVASMSPLMGNDLKRLPEGRRASESRVFFTTTQLFIGGQGTSSEADVITADGQRWEVQHVETWRDPYSGGVCYRCIALSVTG